MMTQLLLQPVLHKLRASRLKLHGSKGPVGVQMEMWCLQHRHLPETGSPSNHLQSIKMLMTMTRRANSTRASSAAARRLVV
jgi:hypothetical protein